MSSEVQEKPDIDGRNLVVCIDGTSNQFGKYNTNVVDLYNKMIKSDFQLTYYNSGIGTYAKPKRKPISFLLKKIDNNVDLAIARDFERNVTKAYRWLSDNYRPGDKIYLFGFSRGAYQVRVLAGMIHTVGLIHKGNEEQIPFAYELYSTHDEQRRNDNARRFKNTFSRKTVHLHFIGVWDTVSSVGIVRGNPLPSTATSDHVCHFRQALALDERRVKFLPEYANMSGRKTGDRGDSIFCKQDPDIKEVWFPGTHSDVGGGNRKNVDTDLLVGGMPLLWMSFEAFSHGLLLQPPRTIQWPWDEENDREPVVTESLSLLWKPFEWFPWTRPSYSKLGSTTRSLHRGRGRKVKLSTQKVHSSIALYSPSYCPKARLDQPPGSTNCYQWDDKKLATKEEWEDKWGAILERGVLDYSLDPGAFNTIETGSSIDQRIWLYSLAIVMQTEKQREGFLNMSHALETLIRVIEKQLLEHTIDLIKEFVTIILTHLNKSRKDERLSFKGSKLLIDAFGEQTATVDTRIVAVQLFGYTLFTSSSITNLINDRMFDVLTTMTGQSRPMTEEADEVLNLFPDLISSVTISYENLRDICRIIRKRLATDTKDSATKEVAQNILKSVLGNDQNCNRIFDSDVISTLFDSPVRSNLGEKSNLVVLGIEHGYIPIEVVREVVLNELCNQLGDNRHLSSSLHVLSVAKAIIPSLDLRDDSQRNKIRYVLHKTLIDEEEEVKLKAVKLCTYAISYDGIFDGTILSSIRSLTWSDLGLEIEKAVMNFYQVATTCQSDVFVERTIHAIWKKLYRVISKAGGSELEQAMLQFFKAAAAARDELVKEIFNAKDIGAFRGWITDASAHHTREGAIRFVSEVGSQDTLVVPEIVLALRDLLGDSESTIRAKGVDFFRAALTQERLRGTLFDKKSIFSLVKQLDESHSSLRMKAINFFKAALTQEDLRDKLFNSDTVAALGNRLGDNRDEVKRETIDFFTAVLNQEGFRDRVLDPHITVLGNRLGDGDSEVRKRAIGFFKTAFTHEDLRDKLFTSDIIAALGNRLGDSESFIKESAVDFFMVALNQESLRDKPSTHKDISSVLYNLDDSDSYVKQAMSFFEAALNRNTLRYTLFTPDSVRALRNLLSDSESSIRAKALGFYKAALLQESLQDRLFNGSTIAALVDQLDDDDNNVKERALDFYKTALTHEGVREKFSDEQNFDTLLSWFNNNNSCLKGKAVDFFTTALNQKDMRNWLFNSNNSNIQSFFRLLDDSDDHVRKRAMDFFKAALTQEALRDILFDAKTISGLGNWLGPDTNLQARAIDYFVLALTQKNLREKLFIPANIHALGKLLTDSDTHLKAKTIDLFEAALTQKDLHAVLFTQSNIDTLSGMLRDSDSNIRRRAVNFFKAVLTRECLRNRSFNPNSISALANLLNDDDNDVRQGAIDFFRVALAQSDLRDKLFPPDVPPNAPSNILSSLRDRLDDSDSSVKITTIDFFKASLAYEKFRDKVFGPETQIISKLWNQLKGDDLTVRMKIIEFFGAAATQGDTFQKGCFDPKVVSAVVGVSLLQETGLPLIRLFSSNKNLLQLLYHCLTISTLCKPLESENTVVSINARTYLTEVLKCDRIRDRISCPKLNGCMASSVTREEQFRHIV